LKSDVYTVKANNLAIMYLLHNGPITFFF